MRAIARRVRWLTKTQASRALSTAASEADNEHAQLTRARRGAIRVVAGQKSAEAIVVAFDGRVRFEPLKSGVHCPQYSRLGTIAIPITHGEADAVKPGWIVDGQDEVRVRLHVAGRELRRSTEESDESRIEGILLATEGRVGQAGQFTVRGPRNGHRRGDLPPHRRDREDAKDEAGQRRTD